MASSASVVGRGPRPWARALLVGLGVVVLGTWWPVVRDDIVPRWSEPRYAHGYLVPAFALYLLWCRRRELAALPGRSSWWGVVLIGLAVALRLAGTAVYWLRVVSLLPALAALVALAGGTAALRRAGPALAFLIFMIPLPNRLERALADPLQRAATQASTYALQVAGFPALADGNIILLGEAQIGVAEACSGLSMMVLFVALSAGLALVVRRPLRDRMMIVASAIPIALIVNVVRITATGVLHEVAGPALADRVFHDLAGWLMMPLALGLLGLELWVLAHLVRAPERTARPDRAAARRRGWARLAGLGSRLDLRFLGGLVAVLVLLAVGLPLLHRVQVGRQVRALRAQASRAEAQDRPGHAAESLARYLAFRPEDSEALARYGMILARSADSDATHRSALLALGRALERDPRRQDVRRELVRLALELGQLTTAREHLETLLRAAPEDAALRRQMAQVTLGLGEYAVAREHLVALLKAAPEDGELEDLLGQCLEADGRYVEAADRYTAAVAHAPDRVEAYVRLAHLLRRRLQQPGRANRVMDELVAANAGSSRAHLARGLYRLEVGLAGADDDVARARELAPDDVRVLQAVARLAAENGDLEAARAALLRGVELQPRDGRLHLALAEVEQRAGRPEEAVTWLRRGLRVLPGSDELDWLQAGLLIEAGRPEEAEVLVDRLRRSGFPGAMLDLLEARRLVRDAQWAEAARVLERATPLLVNRPNVAKQASLLLGDCHGHLGHLDRQLAAYRRALAFDPHWRPARKQLVAALLGAGRVDEAIAESRGVAEDDDAREQLWLGQALAEAGRPAEAEAALRRAVELGGDVPLTWVTLARFLAAAGRGAEAEAVLDEAERRLPPDPAAAAALAAAFEAIDRGDRAEQSYRARLAEHPDDIAAREALAGLYLRSGRVAEAEPHLRRIIDRGAGAAAPVVARARRSLALALAAGGEPGRLAEALALIEANLRDGATVDDRRARAILLATSPDGRRDAIRAFEELAAQAPPTPDEQFLLARLLEADGDWPAARERMRRLLASHGDHPLYLAAFAGSLLSHGETEEAEAWVERLQQVAPASLPAAALKARLLVLRGEATRAVERLEALARQDRAQAGAVAQVLEELGQPESAEAWYREAAAQSDQPENLLVLAAFLSRRDRPQEALELCEQARATCPPQDVAATALAVLSAADVDVAQLRRVESWVVAALREAPQSTALLVDRAILRDLQGHPEEAEAIYRQILQRDGRHVVALNNLAWLLARQGDPAGEALGLIEQAIALAGPVPGLLDTRAMVQLAAGRSAAAIRDLEQAIAQAPTANLYFHLARAHQAARDPEAAARALRKAEALGLNLHRIEPFERTAYHELLSQLRR